MPMMAVGMPTFGAANTGMAAGAQSRFNNTSGNVDSGACDPACERRIERLESDFKALAGDVDEIVDAVERNTLAIEKMLERLRNVRGFSTNDAAHQPQAEPAAFYTSDDPSLSLIRIALTRMSGTLRPHE